MAGRITKPSGILRMSVAVPVLVLIAGAAYYAKITKDYRRDSVKNYAIDFPPLEGWKEIPHGPQTLFLYRDIKNNLLIRGAANQIVADINPTPELHTEAIADYYIARTRENMPEWTASRMEAVDGAGTHFSLIRRIRKDKAVVTAFSVRGNTTLMVSMSANGKEMAAFDERIPQFRKFLTQLSMRPTDLSGL